MPASIPHAVIVDTGFWRALFDRKDQYFADATRKAHYIDNLTVVVPWPTLYETLRTRFVKDRQRMAAWERILNRPNVQLIDDVKYRDDAMEATLRDVRVTNRAISLCDMVIRLLINDPNVRVDALLTYNIRDFVDVCRLRRVQIL